MNALLLGSCTLGLCVIWMLRKLFSRHRKTPPGPCGLPIVGYLPFLSTQLHLNLSQLAKRYGKIFSLQLGSRYVVAICDYQVSKEAFMKDAFQGRPLEIPLQFSKKLYDTGAYFDLSFRDQRRFALHMLRDLGIGKSKMEELIREEISELIQHLEENDGEPFCVGKLLAPSMSNNIGALMFGKRFKYDDPIRKMLNDGVNTAGKSQQAGLLFFFPMLKKLFSFLGFFSIDKNEQKKKQMSNYIKKEVEEHERTCNPDDIRDYIDGYLLEIAKKKDPAFCKDVLQDIAFLFFLAGSETVRLSVEWLLLLAASMPEAQLRIQDEIDEVLGRDRMPEWPDHNSMPYTEAFIMELNRWRTIAPISLIKRTLADTEAGGYFIPKDTIIISSLWDIHHDPEYWGPDADQFRPERFLSEDLKSIKMWDRYIPFSTGKRSCPGEPLAKVEVFLYFTAVLQKFNLRMPNGKKADFNGTLTVALQVKPQDIILTRRQ